MIVIEPIGGLANRMRALDSAIALAKDTRKRLVVLWISNKACNCKYSDLFHVQKEFSRLIQVKPGLSTRVYKKSLSAYFSMFPNYYLSSERVANWDSQSRTAYKTLQDFLIAVHDYNNLYIRTHSAFYHSAFHHPYRTFMPADHIQSKIDSIDTKNMVGIHIRRTDQKISIEYSPLELFVEAMKKEVEADPEVKFFVATDDPPTKTILKELFPNRIVDSGAIRLNRNDPLAIQDALVDLYCLSNCRKIIGSYWSSFTTVAANIHPIERVVVKAEKPETADIEFVYKSLF